MRRLGRSSVSKLAAVTGFLTESGSGSREGSESDPPEPPDAYSDPELMDKEAPKVELGMAGVLKFAGVQVAKKNHKKKDEYATGGVDDEDADEIAERQAAMQLGDMEVGDDDAFD